MTEPSIDWDHVEFHYKWLITNPYYGRGCAMLLTEAPQFHQGDGCWHGQSYSDGDELDATVFASFDPGDCPHESFMVKRPYRREISLTILGQPYSKANSRQLVPRGKRMVSIKSKNALAYEASASLQIAPLDTLMEGDLSATIHIFYPSRRQDLDESLILDALQGKIYKNDRQVKIKHIYHGLDKESPRAEITIREIAK